MSSSKLTLIPQPTETVLFTIPGYGAHLATLNAEYADKVYNTFSKQLNTPHVLNCKREGKKPPFVTTGIYADFEGDNLVIYTTSTTDDDIAWETRELKDFLKNYEIGLGITYIPYKRNDAIVNFIASTLTPWKNKGTIHYEGEFGDGTGIMFRAKADGNQLILTTFAYAEFFHPKMVGTVRDMYVKFKSAFTSSSQTMLTNVEKYLASKDNVYTSCLATAAKPADEPIKPAEPADEPIKPAEPAAEPIKPAEPAAEPIKPAEPVAEPAAEPVKTRTFRVINPNTKAVVIKSNVTTAELVKTAVETAHTFTKQPEVARVLVVIGGYTCIDTTIPASFENGYSFNVEPVDTAVYRVTVKFGEKLGFAQTIMIDPHTMVQNGIIVHVMPVM